MTVAELYERLSGVSHASLRLRGSYSGKIFCMAYKPSSHEVAFGDYEVSSIWPEISCTRGDYARPILFAYITDPKLLPKKEEQR